ncbi:IS66 family insertion sequence element accessory protein TnpB [uncultured Jannaschia sp.]|uniref:IS66 family insertion sequence element accessory protein TnpB n=1 Tax=uncultured Jannaschia sp. TaxID=293347 RepID=UPI00343634A3
MVEESFRGHRQGSATARRYGLSRSQLTRRRKEYREGLLDGGAPAFIPLQIGSAPAISTATETPAIADKVEIMLTNGRR